MMRLEENRGWKEDWVAHLMSKGFDQSACSQALESTGFISIDYAVEYLLAGSCSSHEVQGTDQGDSNPVRKRGKHDNSVEHLVYSPRKSPNGSTTRALPSPKEDVISNVVLSFPQRNWWRNPEKISRLYACQEAVRHPFSDTKSVGPGSLDTTIDNCVDQHGEWIARLLSMGFEGFSVLKALESTGFTSLDDALEYLLNDKHTHDTQGADECSTRGLKRVKREPGQTLRAFLPKPGRSHTVSAMVKERDSGTAEVVLDPGSTSRLEPEDERKIGVCSKRSNVLRPTSSRSAHRTCSHTDSSRATGSDGPRESRNCNVVTPQSTEIVSGNQQVRFNIADPLGNATLTLLQSGRESFYFSGCHVKTNVVKPIQVNLTSNCGGSSERVMRNLEPHTRKEEIFIGTDEPTALEAKLGEQGTVLKRLATEMGCAVTTQEIEPNARYVVRNSNTATDLETQASTVLRKHFGHKNLKIFQKEALEAWAANRDCFILAATGSGKSLCFQLPALMTGKVVVVVSPLISLMHDQCLKLARQGISACFLGSGQSDKNVEDQAMAGMYNIVYVTPETLQRLIASLQELALGRGIALFAVDEAHCVSKWGHDFRPDYRNSVCRLAHHCLPMFWVEDHTFIYIHYWELIKRLSVLRDKFSIQAVGLKNAIPIMALTATATLRVRKDILQSLGIDKGNPTIVLTTFFRPNLRFSVHHSKTKRPLSFKDDFCDLIDVYSQKGRGRHKLPSLYRTKSGQKPNYSVCREIGQDKEQVEESSSGLGDNEFCRVLQESTCQQAHEACRTASSDEDEFSEQGEGMTVEDLEDEGEEEEDERLGGDFDASWEDFCGHGTSQRKMEQVVSERSSIGSELDYGPSIIYVPTRKETVRLANFFCSQGVRAGAYHAKLPKAQLRQVHMDFHEGGLQIVVATIAFGMGIDKPNVRRVIHYGWPQSLEAYYQEAGRAGRDGLISECTLYCDMTVLPSLLPSRRDVEQAQHALTMLSQCFRYGISTSECRAKMLLSYFGEDLQGGQCQMCDTCVEGPPPVEDVSIEGASLLFVLLQSESQQRTEGNLSHSSHRDRITFRNAVEKLDGNGLGRDWLWWRGLGRTLVDLNYVAESADSSGSHGSKLMVPSLKFPVCTVQGLDFLEKSQIEIVQSSSQKMKVSGASPLLLVHPEGDMLQSMKEPKRARSDKASEWGRGWADPDIRRLRLCGKGGSKGKKGKKGRRQRMGGKQKVHFPAHTVRGRLAVKLAVKR